MASLIRNVALNPFVTAPLFAILALGPDQVREPLLQQLRQHLSADTISKAVSTLKWLSVVGGARYAHQFFNELAQNNFRFSSEKHRYNWPREIAVITGAAGGFGSLMAKSLAEKGVTIIAVDIQENMAKDMQANPKIHYYKTDITDKAAVDAMAADVKARYGDPSILINNAGVAFNHHITNATESSVKTIFGVNVMSHYFTCQAFMPAMVANKKGHIVTVASMASFVSPPSMVSYCNTKAAALSFHDGLRSEARVIHDCPELLFTVVHPNFASTGMVAEYEDRLKKAGLVLMMPHEVSDAIVKQILSCRGRQLLLPDNVGNTLGSLFRAVPSWLCQPFLMLAEKGMKADIKSDASS
ncbi:hypothetical protein D0860_01448 [Hortaea werneckii]|uniref:Short-chain dehydrogenase/reductase 3 n=1 Tax=Hortaea werneckii TaxID=91943 RepID=A0A3M7HRC1_HORWE|nr:hypothetical protein D0860_01448 [Hortaea werneckii]